MYNVSVMPENNPLPPSANPSPATAAQLAELRLTPGRPLLVVDADEVLFYFMRGFERHLQANGFYFNWASFALNGNVRRQADDTAVSQTELSPLLDHFFASATDLLDPVDGAAEALAGLAGLADIVVLSNLPLHARDARATALHRHGMPYPIIANTGPKGPAMAALLRHAPRRAAFIDDIPRNHASVAEVAPDVHRVHFIADPRLAVLLPPSEHCQHRGESWAAMAPHLAAQLSG